MLPFANLTGDSGKDFLGEGLAEELIHVLARVPGLRVPSRTSTFAYRGRDIDLQLWTLLSLELWCRRVLDTPISKVVEPPRAAGQRILPAVMAVAS